MKTIVRLIGTLLAIVKLSTASDLMSEDPYLTNNIMGEVKNISISKLLDFKKISVAIEDEFDKARFHYIIAYEIDYRLNDLDNKFNEYVSKYSEALVMRRDGPGGVLYDVTLVDFLTLKYGTKIYKCDNNKNCQHCNMGQQSP